MKEKGVEKRGRKGEGTSQRFMRTGFLSGAALSVSLTAFQDSRLPAPNEETKAHGHPADMATELQMVDVRLK